MTAITQPEIDQQVFNLYDEYCHGRIERREFNLTDRTKPMKGMSKQLRFPALELDDR